MCNHVEPSEYNVQLVALDPKSGSSMVKAPGILSGGSRGHEFIDIAQYGERHSSIVPLNLYDFPICDTTVNPHETGKPCDVVGTV